MLRKAGALAKIISTTFPYGSMYNGSIPFHKPEIDHLTDIIRQKPSARRIPGKCTLKQPLTRKPGPTIANLTIQYCPGKAIDAGGAQTLYLNRHAEHLDKTLSESIQKDSIRSRQNWFTEALSDLHRQIINENIQPCNIYIPKLIACSYSKGSHKEYWEIIKRFSSAVGLSGFNIIAVEKN